MAKMTLKGFDEIELKLSKLEAGSLEIAKKAVYKGAGMVADKISQNIKALPEEKFRYLKDGDRFSGVTPEQKKALADNIGITPIDVDELGTVNAKIGYDRFADYVGAPTRKYPQGLPVALLARSVESGSSVRKKHPFIRPVISQSRKQVKEEMGRVVDEEIKKIMK